MSDQDNYSKILEKLTDVATDVAVVKAQVDFLKTIVTDHKDDLSYHLTDEQAHTRVFQNQMHEIHKSLTQIEREDVVQNRLLAEHIRGVQTNTERLEIEIAARKSQEQQFMKELSALQERVAFAEVFPKTALRIKQLLLGVLGGVPAVYALVKLIESILK